MYRNINLCAQLWNVIVPSYVFGHLKSQLPLGPLFFLLVQKLNPSIEAPVTKILDQIKLNLDKPGRDTKLSVKFKDSSNNSDSAGQKMLLTITSLLAGMPFVWNFHAEPADSTMVSVLFE